MANTSEHITIRMSAELLKAIDAAATADGRSRSQMIVRRLAESFGVVPKPAMKVKTVEQPATMARPIAVTVDTPAVTPPQPVVDLPATAPPRQPRKVGEKCPHGWMNWLSCRQCSPL